MSASPVRSESRVVEENRLLLALPASEYQSLADDLETVTLSIRDALYEPSATISHAYFPQRSVASVLAIDNSSANVVANIGREGMVGMPLFLEVPTSPHHCIVQIAGPSKRIRANDLLRQLPDLPVLQRLLRRYANALFNAAAQTVVCNRHHSFEERCARWLLMTDDCVGGADFALTQEFLSYMLVTRRSSVSIAAGRLQRDGLIQYRRGVVRVLDRAGLEAASCECYAITRSSQDQVFE
jgi:CRP-like cAMP-binding protein